MPLKGRRLWMQLLLTVCALALSAGHDAQAYEPIQVTNGGKISGTVQFVGAVPPAEQLAITRDEKSCGTGTRPSETLVVSPQGGLKNAVVSITNITRGKPRPASKKNPQFVQEKCWFSPHVLLVPAGSTVDLFNRDKVMHNIHTVSKINPVVNKAHPSFKKRLRFKLKKPEVIKVKCDMHTWMGGWFVVTDHPYYALTDANGAFALTDVPPGTYILKVWHETLGEQTLNVSVEAGGETRAAFEFKP